MVPLLFDLILSEVSKTFSPAFSPHLSPLPTHRETPRWFEYNDTRISPFDPKNLPYYTFGGMEEVEEVEEVI